MTHTSCKWNGRQQPRVLSDRHDEACQSPTCAGCLECTEDHCRVCGIAHSDGTCPECLASTRDDLREIGRLCNALPEEVEHRGIAGEAMVMLGPTCDPEARGHLEASVAAGRVPADYLDVSDGDRHPLSVTGSWQMLWQDALEHDDESQITVESAIGYLDRQLTYMAGYEHVPFEDFARDVRDCRSHLESVLHDGEQVDRGAPCLACNVPQERVWGDLAAQDGWRCHRCHTTSTEAQYRFAVKAEHMAKAEWMTATDCAEWLAEIADERAAVLADLLKEHQIPTSGFADSLCSCGWNDDVHASSIPDAHARHLDRVLSDATEMPPLKASAGTIRSWATKKRISKRRDSGRTLYNRADVLDAASIGA